MFLISSILGKRLEKQYWTLQQCCTFTQHWLALAVNSASDANTDIEKGGKKAMYKNRNTRMGNGMRGTRRMGGILYSAECRQTFRGMFSNFLVNVLKHSGECRQTFRGMF